MMNRLLFASLFFMTSLPAMGQSGGEARPDYSRERMMLIFRDPDAPSSDRRMQLEWHAGDGSFRIRVPYLPFLQPMAGSEPRGGTLFPVVDPFLELHSHQGWDGSLRRPRTEAEWTRLLRKREKERLRELEEED